MKSEQNEIQWDERRFGSENAEGWDGADWQAYVLDPQAPFFKSWREIPGEASGVYALWSGNDQLLYIGLSTEVWKRIRAHEAKGVIPFRTITLTDVPDCAMQEVELAHIHALEPPYNRLYDLSYWKGHPFMVDAIRLAWEPSLRKEVAQC